MIRSLGITGKLSLWILAATAAVLLLVIGYSYTFTRGIVLEHIERNAQSLSLATVHRIESVLQPVERCPRAVARIIESKPYERDDASLILLSVLDNFPEIFGTTIAYAPGFSAGPGEAFAPYYFRDPDGEIRYRDLAKSYDYLISDWYADPQQLGQAMWGEPYLDEGGGDVWMATYSVPIYQEVGEGREFVGIVTADISLDWLHDVVAGLKTSPSAFAVIVSRNGRILASSENDSPELGTIAEMADEHGDEDLRAIGEEMTSGGSGFVSLDDLAIEERRWIAYMPLLSGGWSLAISFPEDEIMRDVAVMRQITTFLALAGIIVLFVVIVLVSKTITRPLRTLTVTAQGLGAGDLDSELPQARSRDEVGRLTQAFSSMQSELKTYIAELTATTAAKERIEADLRIAHGIQQSMVPTSFPEVAGVDIAAVLRPAKEVGGDLYDVFQIGHEIVFLIGDVSGKGVPAALMMAVASTLLRTVGGLESDPAGILARANVDLSEDNDACMFVTAFLGVLNIRTGRVRYASAGHNDPVLLREDGRAEYLALDPSLPLGLGEDSEYMNKELTLAPGETFLLYTDGITEAFNPDYVPFGEEAFVEGLSKAACVSAEDVVEASLNLVDEFVAGAPASDDLTVLALRIGGGA